MIVRHDKNGRKYLYDIINIKKKRAPRLGNSRTVTNPFLVYNINLFVNKSQL